MKNHLRVWILSVIFCVVSTLVLAGNGNEGNKTVGCSAGAEMERTQTRDQKRLMENLDDNGAPRVRDRTQSRLQEGSFEENIVYLAQDGKTYEWSHRYSRRLKMYENENNQETIHRLLYRIAKRHRFSHEEDVRGFTDWALKHRPWKNI